MTDAQIRKLAFEQAIKTMPELKSELAGDRLRWDAEATVREGLEAVIREALKAERDEMRQSLANDAHHLSSAEAGYVLGWLNGREPKS